MRVIKSTHEHLDAQPLFVKLVYGQVPTTTARRVRNDWKLPKVNIAEATARTFVCDDAKLYQRPTLRIERDDEVRS